LGKPAALPADATLGKTGGSKTWLIAAAGILLLAVSVGAYYWMSAGPAPETVGSAAGTATDTAAAPTATTASPPATSGVAPAQPAAVQDSRPENKPPARVDAGAAAKAPVAADPPAPPKTAADYFSDGLSLEEQKNLPSAIDNYRKACELAPKNASYAIQLALALQKNRSLKGAANYLQRAIALGGDQEHPVASLKARLAQVEKQAALAGVLPYNALVRHDHVLGKGCDGKLRITEAEIRFEPAKQMDHALQASLTTIKSLNLKKNRMEVVLTSGKKYSFDVPDPAPVQKIVDAWK
jgi:hypothetical protein